MSLLMQALKKAERARQSGLQEEELADVPEPEATSSEPQDAPDVPDLVYDGPGRPFTAGPSSHGAAMEAPAGTRGLELSPEPLDGLPPHAPAAAPAAMPAHERAAGAAAGRAPPPAEPPAPIQPALEATHNPVPPQARHEGARARPDAEIPVADARPAPGPAGRAGAGQRATARPERRAMPRGVETGGDNTSGIDMARLRLAGLAGILVIVAGTFGYVYWKGVSGPGPGASLPMVPMPPPSATGATAPSADGSIVVSPAGPPFGPLGAPAAGTDAGTGYAGGAVPASTQAQPEAAAPAAPVVTAAPAEPPQPAPRSRRPAATPRPTPAQLAAIADPEMRREAQRDAEERAEREMRLQANASMLATSPMASVPAGTGPAYAAPGSAYPPAGAAYVPPGPAGDVQVARGAAAPAIAPAVQAGYAAFGAGDLATARRHYAMALQQDPNNRDALLGSAAVAARERRDDDAAGYYARLLAANPRDADAIAGLVGLRPGDGDRAEIRLRGVLRNNQNAPSVHFALGNLYARQGRWQEAQQAYFHAWSAAPGNADYAFNLAVGLDHLNQGRLAREYYGRALALSAGGAAAFDRAAVQRRLQELGAAAAAPAGAPAPRPAPAAVAAPVPADAQVPVAPAGN